MTREWDRIGGDGRTYADWVGSGEVEKSPQLELCIQKGERE